MNLIEYKRREFKDSYGAKLGALFPLSELWLPIQAEVSNLLLSYARFIDNRKAAYPLK